ncbi:hypothetical protein LINGRAHAP2_LOCUS10480, partial [Linum grandiflorum]
LPARDHNQILPATPKRNHCCHQSYHHRSANYVKVMSRMKGGEKKKNQPELIRFGHSGKNLEHEKGIRAALG